MIPNAECKCLRHLVSYIADGSKLCIVMEYCEAGDMLDKITSQKGEPFPEKQVPPIFLSLSISLFSRALIVFCYFLGTARPHSWPLSGINHTIPLVNKYAYLRCQRRRGRITRTALRKRGTRGFPLVSTWKNKHFYIVYIERIVFQATPWETGDSTILKTHTLTNWEV